MSKPKTKRGVKPSKRSVSPSDQEFIPKKKQTSTITSTATDTSQDMQQITNSNNAIIHPVISRQARHHQKPKTSSILLPTKEPLAINNDAPWKCLPPPKVDAIRRKRKEWTLERLLQIRAEYDQMIQRQEEQAALAQQSKKKKKNNKKKKNKKSKNKKETTPEPATTIPELIHCYKRNKKLQEFRFARHVSIRVYDQILGDHPCVSSGLPVQLGWIYRGESTDFASYGKQDEPQEQRQREKKKVPIQSNGNRTTTTKRKQKQIYDDERLLSSCPMLSPERRLEIVSMMAGNSFSKKQEQIMHNIHKVQRQRYHNAVLWWNFRKLQEIFHEDIPRRFHQRRHMISRQSPLRKLFFLNHNYKKRN